MDEPLIAVIIKRTSLGADVARYKDPRGLPVYVKSKRGYRTYRKVSTAKTLIHQGNSMKRLKKELNLANYRKD